MVQELQAKLKTRDKTEKGQERKDSGVELARVKRELYEERKHGTETKMQADAFRFSNNFLETRVKFLELGLEQELRQSDGLRQELGDARRMVVELETEWVRLEAAFTSLQKKYQSKADLVERRLGKCGVLKPNQMLLKNALSQCVGKAKYCLSKGTTEGSYHHATSASVSN